MFTDTGVTGNYGIYLSTTNANYFGGPVRSGTTAALVATNEGSSVLQTITAGHETEASCGLRSHVGCATDTALTGGGAVIGGLIGRFYRTITGNVTDTANCSGLLASATTFNVANTKTLTNSAGSYNGLYISAPTNAGAGSLAITKLTGLNIAANTLTNTGTNYGAYIEATSGGSVANYQLYSAGTALSYFAGKVAHNLGLQTQYVAAAISNPPTAAEIISAFGAAATAGAGFVGVLKDSGVGAKEYTCACNGATWSYALMTAAA